MTDEQMWDSADVAKFLDLHQQTVSRMAARGDLPGIKIGRAWRFRPEDIRAELDRRLATNVAQFHPAQK
ncbi:MAG: helix-turn-helix domain-containing protein [Caldilineaceae bacterium]|nr:helix-turn-helix domain-containing protein [Caldilineaceae bacterium]MBP8106918.1 helix-turn-helix domain-containing protein [Caldilineaceae bacterium]MBP8121838.1 helix-turn-helix domain-containing protein [Caldilineaceae bacterium]MBP9072138.1 helix-turn-helix domain-containing protein [Caldilineaceae bacterium]